MGCALDSNAGNGVPLKRKEHRAQQIHSGSSTIVVLLSEKVKRVNASRTEGWSSA
jgi:hypothetical protein